ncbi:MAG TPA: XdhC family protein [Bryobacteraceae bacterium]|nr:XdhC family protein [Bryobacteraceae bacterium]
MKELEQILALWSQLEARNEAAVLATVVKTSGSSYRLPGARLLLTRTGQRVGSVSGGCLEDDLVKRAWWLTDNGPVIRRYDTTPEGEIAAEYGLGCNGIIYVLLERISTGTADTLLLIQQVHELRRSAAIAHVIEPVGAAGQKFVIDPDGLVRHDSTRTVPREALERQTRSALAEGQSHIARIEDTEIFAETLTPPLRLLVFGAGDDAVPLVTLAKFLGWEVFVFDGRAHYARRDKFPQADGVSVRAPGSGGSDLPVDPWTAAVLMSHSYSQDCEMLKELSDRKLFYVGVLGPRKRAAQMLRDAGLDDVIDSPAVHSPMGLDIGADGPEQVALSVVAEIQATVNKRRGGFLRERSGPIHAGDPHSDNEQVRKPWIRSIVCA